MKKTKLEKGITLIALIITIVVLLILAVVTIGAIQESKIIAHAKNAASGYKTKADEENTVLGKYIDIINHYAPKEEDKDDIKRILEIRELLNELDYDKETTPQEEIDRRKAEIAKLEAEYEEIIGYEHSISFYMQNDDYHYGYLYNPLNKKFFKSTLSEDGIELTYVLEDDEANEILAEVIEFKEYLEKEFVGKTYEEIKVMYDNNEIIPKINNEFEASKNLIELKPYVASYCLDLYCDKESKTNDGECFEFDFSMLFDQESGKLEGVRGSDYLWGA